MSHTILMSPPTHFDVTYQINPWMRELGSVTKQAAMTEWNELFHAVNQFATVYAIPPIVHPDFVFTANAGLARGREIILSSFKHNERQAEEPYWQELFRTYGYTIRRLHDVSFEGAGDALFAGNLLIGGYGIRTDRAAYDQIQSLWHDIAVLPVQLVDERWYHLDTCLCVLSSDTILYFPDAFSKEAQNALEARFRCLAINEEEALRFACNAVVFGRHVIVPSGTPKTQSLLWAHGFTAQEVHMDEFLKSGGAAKCLTLAL